MIYCNLKGGLCNMMFQIAATTSLAIDNKTTASFPNLEEHFNLLYRHRFENKNFEHTYEYKLIFNNLNITKPKVKNLIRYPFHYVNKHITDNVIIDGFFQSEKYFKHNRDFILEMFKPPQKVRNIIENKYNFLINDKTVSMHIRRGDYLKYPNHHPIINIDYYNRAIEYFNEKLPNSYKLVIFSDDIDWCKKHFIGENVVYIEDEKDYIELYLMSMCDNNIIANSSFSWWGAWLNKNINKIIIAPDNWFGPNINFKSDDIIPENWIKL